MKRMMLAALSLAAIATPALAQYYPYPPQGGYYERPPPRGYYRPDPWGGGGGYYQRPVEFGNICYTSRGSCRTRPRPVQSNCSCNIPGFGPKRGGVVSGGW